MPGPINVLIVDELGDVALSLFFNVLIVDELDDVALSLFFLVYKTRQNFD